MLALAELTVRGFSGLLSGANHPNPSPAHQQQTNQKRFHTDQTRNGHELREISRTYECPQNIVKPSSIRRAHRFPLQIVHARRKDLQLADDL
jgi:hypothetical protein